MCGVQADTTREREGVCVHHMCIMQQVQLNLSLARLVASANISLLSVSYSSSCCCCCCCCLSSRCAGLLLPAVCLARSACFFCRSWASSFIACRATSCSSFQLTPWAGGDEAAGDAAVPFLPPAEGDSRFIRLRSCVCVRETKRDREREGQEQCLGGNRRERRG